MVAALSSAGLVVDLTVEGMLHAPELPAILKGGARLLMVSNEHPESAGASAARSGAGAEGESRVKLLKSAQRMHVTSEAGTDLTVALDGAPAAGVWGWCDRPGSVAHWPGGLCLWFRAPARWRARSC